jgi:hypothetical protein
METRKLGFAKRPAELLGWSTIALKMLLLTIVSADFGTTQGVATPLERIQAKEFRLSRMIFGLNVQFQVPAAIVQRRPGCTLPIGLLSGYADKRDGVRSTWGKGQCVFFMVGKTNGMANITALSSSHIFPNTSQVSGPSRNRHSTRICSSSIRRRFTKAKAVSSRIRQGCLWK